MGSSVSKVSDTLCLILVAASQKSGTRTFTIRHIDFQRIFKNSTNPLIKEVIFSDSGPEHFSPILDASLNQLIFAGLTGCPDIQYPEQIFIKPSAFEYAMELSRSLSQAEKKQVDRLADEFLSGIRP